MLPLKIVQACGKAFFLGNLNATKPSFYTFFPVKNVSKNYFVPSLNFDSEMFQIIMEATGLVPRVIKEIIKVTMLHPTSKKTKRSISYIMSKVRIHTFQIYNQRRVIWLGSRKICNTSIWIMHSPVGVGKSTVQFNHRVSHDVSAICPYKIRTTRTQVNQVAVLDISCKGSSARKGGGRGKGLFLITIQMIIKITCYKPREIGSISYCLEVVPKVITKDMIMACINSWQKPVFIIISSNDSMNDLLSDLISC